MADRPDLRDALRVAPGTRVRLGKADPGDAHGWEQGIGGPADRTPARAPHGPPRSTVGRGEAPVLVVLQGIDAAGKDGTITKVMSAFNPQGCEVTSFKVPTAEELAHDFLWRIHKAVPRKGEIGIFNRSHYEDVLVVRVHDLVPKAVWSKRYQVINEFERNLTESGTTIVKFFLSISREEQRQRFQERYDDPTKRWKFSMGDLAERKLWDDYQAAFEEALTQDLDRLGAVVRHPVRPELVPESRGRDDPRRHARRRSDRSTHRSPADVPEGLVIA